MSEIFIKNISGRDFDKRLVEDLSLRIKKWRVNSVIPEEPICILIQNARGTKTFGFSYTTEAWEKLNGNVDVNLLNGLVSKEFEKWNKKIQGILEFNICVGFSLEDVEKMLDKNKSKEGTSSEVLKVSPIEPKFNLEDVILSEKVKEEIDNVVSLLLNIPKIYYDWGFIDIDPVPKSIVNFWGPPGTGKTMAVHAIAKKLQKKLLVLNYADIESKYVGDAPKNLVAAFDIAEKEDAVIFFDEADSFLGKRITNVQQGAEQSINSLRSQMLMKLEEFKGMVFFATNLHENYDIAFESRILKHIEFTLPDKDSRKKIINKKFPTKAPYGTDVFSDGTFNEKLLEELSEITEGFSGREIKNCMLESLVKASRQENPCVTSEILVSAFKSKKEEKDALTREENERKEKLKNAVKKHLDEKDYSVKKLDESEATV